MARLVPKIPQRKRHQKAVSIAEACTRAKRDHERAVGKRFVVDEVDGYVGYDNVTCGPAAVRVLETDEYDICRVVDDFLDPYWEVEVVGGNEECKKLRSTWVYGPSYKLKKRGQVGR